jgi:Flp pilus assembly protein TadD
MKIWAWPALFVLPLVVVAVTLVARPHSTEWTTSSPEALAEFEAGNDAQAKVYITEALDHFERAHEYDPEFLMAKWRYAALLWDRDPEGAQKLLGEVATADLSGLSEREQFILERWRANREGRTDDAARLLDEYLEQHPNDPYGLNMKANESWGRTDYEKATRLFQHLLEIDPNWVNAHNALGYIAMTQGRFVESEEHFKSYRFIVPDQANPHDSLGELLIILGRHDEAEASLERAIELKPDFWASYEHLAIMKAHSGDPDGARAVISRALAAGMPEDKTVALICLADYAEMAGRDDWQQILEQRESRCVQGSRSGYPLIITHRAACRAGEWEVVQALEDEAAGALLEAERGMDERSMAAVRATIHHLQGVRLAAQGDLESARERLLAADRKMDYLETHQGIFKLYNRMILVEVLLAADQDADAHRLLADVRNTNPPMIAEFERSGFRILGLDRG